MIIQKPETTEEPARNEAKRSMRALILYLVGAFAIAVAIGSYVPSQTSLRLDTLPQTGATDTPGSASSPSQGKSSPAGTGEKKPTAEAVQAKESLPTIGLSVADTLSVVSQQELNKELDDMASLGVGWIRIDFDWGNIQRSGSDSFAWSGIDRIVAGARARNIRILGILLFTPSWARPDGCSSNRCPPAQTSTFATFAASAAKRYASSGVHDWEIWNEPNLRAFWASGADAADYTALLKTASLAIKDQDPSARIILGGLAARDTGNGSISPIDFLADVYARGGGPYFDAVGFHPYSFPLPPGYAEQSNAWQQMENTRPSVRSVMAENGDSAKQIWLTEYGAPTGGPGARATEGTYLLFPYADHVSEEWQAEMLTAAVTDARTHSWIGPFFWYSYQDIGTSSGTNENFFGLLRYDGSKKPAYTALEYAIASLH